MKSFDLELGRIRNKLNIIKNRKELTMQKIEKNLNSSHKKVENNQGVDTNEDRKESTIHSCCA